MEDYTINPYMGCSFDCVYCYINGSKYAKKTNSYYVKSNACDLVYNKLKKLSRNHERAFLNLGSASDPYGNRKGIGINPGNFKDISKV